MYRYVLITLSILCLATNNVVPASGEVYRLENDHLAREFTVWNGIFFTSSIINKDAGIEYKCAGGEFALKVYQGNEYKSTIFVFQGIEKLTTPAGNQVWEVTLQSEQIGLGAVITYTLGENDSYMTKQIRLYAVNNAEVVIDRLDVEHIQFADGESIKENPVIARDYSEELGKPNRAGYHCRLGQGQPFYMDNNLFAGVEYPAGYNTVNQGMLTCYHYPGRTVQPGQPLLSKSTVLGVSKKGEIRKNFFAYIAEKQLSPRPLVHYNNFYSLRGWYNFRPAFLNLKDQQWWRKKGYYQIPMQQYNKGRKQYNIAMTQENTIREFRAFKENLIDPYGINLDTYCLDGGWHDINSLYELDPICFPSGLDPLQQVLEQGGTRLSLWLTLGGLRIHTDWSKQQGYEISPASGGTDWKHKSMAGPKFHTDLKQRLQELIVGNNLNYLKHDFNFLVGIPEGCGILTTNRHSFEANTDALIDFLTFEKQLSPELYLNVTSSMWLSPWWLWYAESIWRGYSDYGYVDFPSPRPRDWDMNYVDVALYRNFHEDNVQFYISALMTCGIIKGQLNMPDGFKEPIDHWSDYVAHRFGTGEMLQELYLSPDLMTKDEWRVMAKGIRWYRANWETLVQSELIGGNPQNGEVDYMHGVGPWYQLYQWMATKEMGGSSHLAAGCHAMDSLLSLLGSDVEEVFSYSSRSDSPDFKDYEYDATIVTILKCKDGKIGKVLSSIDCKMPYVFPITLLGSKGTIRNNKVFSHKYPGQTSWADIPTILPDSGDVTHHPFDGEIDHFVDCILNGGETITNIDWTYMVHEVLLAADQSAAEGKPVKLPLE